MTNGFLDGIKPDRIGIFEKEFFLYLDSRKADLLRTIREEKTLSEATIASLKDGLTEFNASFNG
ncbi:MAG: ATP synthase F1, alpha subunit [Leptospirillum sp. Group IV 'UBA BS']|nr:MAG: ATP synthase F1, alpha subunit [Leptospirillum sp. Group IV 'UBA BS']